MNVSFNHLQRHWHTSCHGEAIRQDLYEYCFGKFPCEVNHIDASVFTISFGLWVATIEIVSINAVLLDVT